MSSVKWETNNGHRAAERAVASAAPQAAACHPSRAGFTLMELLVVITILGLISTIAVSSYFGITRAAAYSAAHDNLYNTLVLTKQRAVIDGKVTSLVLLSPDKYVAVRAVGRISHVVPPVGSETDDQVHDAYADLSGAVATGVEVYNLDATSATISQTVTISQTANLAMDDPFTSAANDYPATAYKFAGTGIGFFTVGDRYGFALHSKQVLPRGYAFASASFPLEVRFNPDGSCAEAVVIEVVETIRASNTIRFEIEASGTVRDTSTVPP
jgi:prepilin-type N-terminal cleavage/methylation domain-containing protein